MGLGNDRKNMKYVSLRIMVGEGDKKAVDPAFVLSQKTEHGWVKGEAFQYVTGELIDIKKDKYVYQGRDVPQIALFLYDKSEDAVYKVEMGYSGLTRSILNSLMNIPDYKDLKIIVYKKTLKEKDNLVVPGSVVWYNFSSDRQKGDWLVQPEDIKAKFTKVVIRGKEETDTFPADEMIADMAIERITPRLRKIDEMLPASDIGSSGEESVLDQARRDRAEREAKEAESGTNDTTTDEGDDLPF